MTGKFVQLHCSLMNAIIRLVARTLFNPLRFSEKKILVVRKGNIGDVVCSLPSFYAIRSSFPGAEIHLLTTDGEEGRPQARQILPEGIFNEVFEFRDYPGTTLFNKIRKAGYEAVIELPPDTDSFFNQMRNMLFFRLASISNGSGWGVSRTGFFHSWQVKHTRSVPEQTRLANVLSGAGINHVPERYDGLYTAADLEVVRQLIASDPGRQWVAIAVGAKLEKKKWPGSYFRIVAEELISKGFGIVAVGDHADAEIIRSFNLPVVVNLCGQLTIRQSAALLSLCRFTVTNDSGPMHLSYGAGTPVIALFSARNYQGKWNPPDDGLNVVLSDYTVPCAGCMNKPCADNICLKQIRPEKVIDAMKHLV